MWEWFKRRDSLTNDDGVLGVRRTPLRTGAMSGKYSSLHTYLKNRYASVVVLTLEQIEDLLGFELPVLARTQGEWWTITDSAETPPRSDAWRLAGRTANPNLLARTVTFERTDSGGSVEETTSDRR